VVRRLGLGVLDEVVAAAEALAAAGQRDHVDLRVEVRLLHALGQFPRHVEGNGVGPLGTVQRDAGDTPADVVTERVQAARARSTIASASTDGGSIP
jgi:hypothetical protein